MATLVFVYGTLMRGGRYHELLSTAAYRGEGRTEARFELVDLGPYPAMVEGGRSAVVGELYAVDAATLERLDELEGHPGYYRRTEIALEDGRCVVVYLMPRGEAGDRPRIASGDWRRK